MIKNDIIINKSYDFEIYNETELFRLSKQGDIVSQNKLVDLYFYLLVSISNNYKENDFVSRDDILKFGKAGLLFAIKNYDETIEYDFSCYASFWINEAIKQGRKKAMISINLAETNKRICRARNKFIFVNHRFPTDEELSRISGVKSDILKFVCNHMNEFDSLGLEQISFKPEKTIALTLGK